MMVYLRSHEAAEQYRKLGYEVKFYGWRGDDLPCYTAFLRAA